MLSFRGWPRWRYVRSEEDFERSFTFSTVTSTKVVVCCKCQCNVHCNSAEEEAPPSCASTADPKSCWSRFTKAVSSGRLCVRQPGDLWVQPRLGIAVFTSLHRLIRKPSFFILFWFYWIYSLICCRRFSPFGKTSSALASSIAQQSRLSPDKLKWMSSMPPLFKREVVMSRSTTFLTVLGHCWLADP